MIIRNRCRGKRPGSGHLEKHTDAFPVRFHIPKPLPVNGRFLFRLQDMPVSDLRVRKRHPKGYAIAFLAHFDYFRYPNQGGTEKPLGSKEFLETVFRNAFLFGMLTASGIIHGAPVPLFHNRVQGPRRNDHGVYLWERGGPSGPMALVLSLPQLRLFGHS